MKVVKKIKEVGCLNTVRGSFKMIYYYFLQKKYGFNKWHISPFELRKYIQDAARYINQSNPKAVIDIGCGLGELLRHISAESRIGYDLDFKNIQCACRLDHSGGIQFHTGSFERVKGQTADFLVTLNFTAGMTESDWRPVYERFLNNNNIKMVMADILPAVDGNHHLDFKNILPKEYRLKDRLGPYLSKRYIHVFEKI